MCYINAQELKAAASIASTDETRRILNGVCVEISTQDEDLYTVASTDSYMLFVAHNHKYKYPQRYIIDKEPLKHLKAKDRMVDIKPFDDTHVLATIIGGNSISQSRAEIWETIDGNYPNFRQLIDTSRKGECGEFSIDPDYIAKMSKAIKDASKCRAVTINCMTDTKPINITAANDAEYFGLVMPVRVR